MNRCANCGIELPGGAEQCPWCGASTGNVNLRRRRSAAPETQWRQGYDGANPAQPVNDWRQATSAAPPPAPITRPDYGKDTVESQPTPRRRRAGGQDRTANVGGVLPSQSLRGEAGTIGETERPPESMSRGYQSRKNISEPGAGQTGEKAPPTRLPVWLIVVMSAALAAAMIAVGLWIFTQGKLDHLQDEKQDAYNAIVASHPRDYRALYEDCAEEYNLQPAFVAAIIKNESSFRSTAESNVGARGLMQLMEGTAGWINERLNIPGYSFDSMWDPETNIRFGCWYLRYLSNMFDGDPVLVTCAYHAGQGSVTAWLNNPDYSPDGVTLEIDSIPMEDTRTYARRVMRDYAIYDALYYRVYNDETTAINDPGATAPPAEASLPGDSADPADTALAGAGE